MTQRGGAERVVLSMLRAFPDAPLYTSLYSPERTFPEFRQAEVRPLSLNRFEVLRHNHRLAAPFLAPAFSKLKVEADVVLCSTSGWAHGVQTFGRKVVYCYTPARWLYQADRYLKGDQPFLRAAVLAIRPFLVRWDHNAARSAVRYLTTSSAVRDRIRLLYGIDAELLPAPFALTSNRKPVEGIEPGFFLCVSRLLPYKNVDAVVAAFGGLTSERLIVVGTGPEEKRLRRNAPRNVCFLGVVSDEQLRWLYENSAGLVAASFEDYGMTPLEAAANGKPTAALRWGGFLDTVVDRETGVFFNAPTSLAIREAVLQLGRQPFQPDAIRVHASRYTEDLFIGRLKAIVEGEMRRRPDNGGEHGRTVLSKRITSIDSPSFEDSGGLNAASTEMTAR